MASDGLESRRIRQLTLVALCLLGLLIAAFAAPTISASGPGVGPPPGGGGGGGGSGGEGGGGGAGIEDLVRWLAGETDSDSDERERDEEPPPLQRPETQSPPAEACSVRFVDDPLPGERVTIAVTKGRDEIEGATVTLNGESVGTTNTYGQVDTVVPYERRLALRARLPGDVTCSQVSQPEGLDAPVESAPASRPLLPGGPNRPATSRVAAGTRKQADGGNVSNSYSVDATVNITVEGRPIPGKTVELEVQVDSVPMRQATVEVDGEAVGQTDNTGEFDLALPADGRERITVRVSRGDFNGTKDIRLAQLSASLRPTTVIAIPGGDTRVQVTLGQDPVAGATVSYRGQAVSETTAQGQTTISLPSDPTASVTVEAASQRVRKAVWPLYAGTALIGALALVAGVAAVALLVFGVTWLVRLLRWLASAALRLATRLEDAVVWLRIQLGRFRRWVADLVATGRESVPALVARLGSWLLDLPGLALAGLLAVLGWIRDALVWLWHVPGRLWRWLWSLRESDEDGADDADDGRAAATGPSAGVHEGPTSLRERWRAFARWVSPRDWRKRTPGEVARDAVATGFPDEPVETLTDVFRDVEYGNVPLSEARREQAREAFESLAEHRRGGRRPTDRYSSAEPDGDRTRSTDGGRHVRGGGTGASEYVPRGETGPGESAAPDDEEREGS
jgi:hypothetical protein